MYIFELEQLSHQFKNDCRITNYKLYIYIMKNFFYVMITEEAVNILASISVLLGRGQVMMTNGVKLLSAVEDGLACQPGDQK